MNDLKYCYKHPHPAVTTDCVIFGFDGRELNVLLVERGIEPFKGHWAFPGGFLLPEETADEGALRELTEETGLQCAFLEQFHTYSDPKRDPRERVITISYLALVRLTEVRGGDDAADAKWFRINDVPNLAFDHDRILRDALARLRERIHFVPIGYDLLPEKFTMKELQNLYEAILNVRFDKRNFAKKMLHFGIVGTTIEEHESENKRIPTLYTFNIEKYNELKQRGFRLEF